MFYWSVQIAPAATSKSALRLCFSAPLREKLSPMQSRRRSARDAAHELSAASPQQTLERTFQRAVKLLAKKPRSIAELRERLLRGRTTNKTVVETVIGRLREYGYLDDERFAVGYASSRVRQRPIGRLRLQRDLMLQKVNREVADEALNAVFNETPEEELIDRAIDKRVRLRGRPQNRAEAKKLFDHLLRQGFPYELVSEKVRGAMSSELADEDLS
jgi:regulatory protein